MADFSDETRGKVKLTSPKIIDLVSQKLLELRKRLLDLTRRNPLIHIRFRATSTSAIRVVDELPEVLRSKLADGARMRLAPLPALEEEIPDEQTDEFLDALHIARTEDETYLTEVEKIDSFVDELERALKDRLRADLGMPPRQTKDALSLVEHARLHGISPSHLLPETKDAHKDGRHDDDDIQTLLLPDRLSRAAKSILGKGRSFERDTGEDLREDSESILDMANVAFMPVRQLRWHYRSRHSALIEFSNRWMYKGELTILPSALEDHPGLGVELKEVPGAYKGGRNEIEAQEIVRAAVHHMEHRPGRSLGICTMNVPQKDLILEEFERERERNAGVRDFVEKWEEENDALEEFFIKNLETIQGDERDVIMISTLYGPETPGGRVLQRFGPINKAHGHRRLNVLFTRAKRQIVTFTSMKPTDILVDGNKIPGVRMFRAWLEYSKTGHIADRTGPRGETESPFEDYVATCIERLGYEAVPQVGVAGFRIDLGIRHPDWPYGYILGVECDGAAYHSSKSSRDRDRLRQEVLEGLGWRLHRIWSTDWFRNPGKEVQILKEVIADALARAKAQGVQHSEKLPRIAERTEPEPPAASATEKQETPVRGNVQASVSPRQYSLPIDPEAAAVTANAQSVALGSRVKIENLSAGGKKQAFTLVEGQNDPDTGKVGIHTPLGEALIDAQVGEEVEYQVKSDIKEVRVLEIRGAEADD